MKIKLFKLLIILALIIFAGLASAIAEDSFDIDDIEINTSEDSDYESYFPESFNLADENLVSQVKNQGQHGNAWTFAIMSALESNYLLKNYNAISLDLSALHTAWFVYNDANSNSGRAYTFVEDIDDDDGLDSNDASQQSQAVTTLNTDILPVNIIENGKDNNLKALALFARLDGPTLSSQLMYPAEYVLPWRPEESDSRPSFPFNLTVNGTSRTYNSTAPMPAQIMSASDYTPAIRVTEALFLNSSSSYSSNSSNDLYINNRYARDFVKTMILSNGAVAAGIDLYNNNFNNNAYYSKSVSSGDAKFLCVHNILITGWDDNYPRENFALNSGDLNMPVSNGAWIAQNSWGSDWGDNGYFYISYEEPLKTPMAFITEAYDRHIRHYGNDLLGYTGKIYLGSGEGSSNAWSAAALRIAGDHEKLREIGFYTTEPNMTYEFYIYKQGNITAVTSPLSNEQLSAATGEFEYPGWHVVKLPKAIAIEKGCMFSIILSLTNEAGPAPIAVETKLIGSETENAIINSGSSFFSLNGLAWQDGTKISNIIAPSNVTLSSYDIVTAADACIKAFTYIPDSRRAEDWTIYINKDKAEIQFPIYSETVLKRKDIEVEASGVRKLKHSITREKSGSNFYLLKISCKITEDEPAITALIVNDTAAELPLGGIKFSTMTAVDTNPNKNVSTSSSSSYSNQRYEGCNNLNLSSGLLLMLLAIALLKLKFKA
ncbi:MAG: hypothetical protein IJG62_05375 [Synergistaceae bacterium]|nr:hypothetical protein [Synergistaceae bacterium]MBQ4418808.1 hypothetical protein [Synergistaceae bacterium]MBQ7569374.1 hypothetical protein [Synergistaceae bacterium]MBQ9582007.1 hypothetical protein [Synergistaceae bacterium]MBQ9896967.1 hypothetical protein [Synergistaceae bacterium]